MSLRIARWSINALELAYHQAVTWADITESGAPLLVLTLTGDDGSVGVGEVTVKPTWYGVGYQSLIGALEEIFLPMACRLDVSDPDAFVNAAASVIENQVAKALIDNALWDLRAAAAKKPLWQAWNGDSYADTSWLVTRQAPSMMAAEAARMVDRHGFKVLKLKGGQGFETDFQMVREVRSAVGDGVRLYLDANWHYGADVAVEYVNRLAGMGLVAVEDPCSIQPDRRFESIQRDARAPIIVDYFSTTLGDAQVYSERGLQALSLKPARVGLTSCRRQAAFSSSAGFKVHVGFGGESDLGTMSSLQLAASLPSRAVWLPAEVTFFLMMKDRLLIDPLVIKEGRVDFGGLTSVSALVDFEKVRGLSRISREG